MRVLLPFFYYAIFILIFKSPLHIKEAKPLTYVSVIFCQLAALCFSRREALFSCNRESARFCIMSALGVPHFNVTFFKVRLFSS